MQHRFPLSLIRVWCVVVCCVGGVQAADTPAKLPRSAEPALTAYSKALADADAAYAKARLAASVAAIRALEKVLKDQTKAGDLDSANAVKAKIDELADKAGDAPGDKATPAARERKPGGPVTGADLAGVWICNTKPYTFMEDGTIATPWSTGTYVISGRTITLSWSDAANDTETFSADGRKMTGTSYLVRPEVAEAQADK